jgi:hypothetical protein
MHKPAQVALTIQENADLHVKDANGDTFSHSIMPEFQRELVDSPVDNAC